MTTEMSSVPNMSATMHLTMLYALLSAENTLEQLNMIRNPTVNDKLGLLRNTCLDIMVGRNVTLVVQKLAVAAVERQRTNGQVAKIRFALTIQALLHDTRHATLLENRLIWLRRQLLSVYVKVSRCLCLGTQQPGSQINLAHRQNNLLRTTILDAQHQPSSTLAATAPN